MSLKSLHKFWTKRKKVKIKESVNYTTSLPNEIWTKILGYLSVVDLCEVVLVSKFMNSVCCDPILWTGITVSKTKVCQMWAEKNYGRYFWESFGGLFDIERFTKLEKLDVSHIFLDFPYDNCFDNTYQPTSLLSHNNCLKKVNLSGLGLSGVEEEFFANGLCKLRIVDLSGARITTDQLTSFILASVTSTTLEAVNLQYVLGISAIPANVFAKIVHRPARVDLSFNKLTSDQLTSLFQAVILSKRIQSLLLVGIDLFHVDGLLLCTAITRLHGVALGGNTLIRTDLLDQLFSRCLQTNILKEVNLDRLHLGHVEPENLAKATASFEKAVLSGTGLKFVHVTTILFHSIASTSLKEIHLDRNDLSEIDADLLAEAVSHIPTVWLGGTLLTSDQLTAVFSRSTVDGSHLKELSVAGVNLSGVNAEVLAQGVARLEMANLSATRMKASQIKALLTCIKTSNIIKLLNIENVPQVWKISSSYLSQATKNNKVDIKIRPLPLRQR